METIALIFALFAFLFAVLALAGAAFCFWRICKEKEARESDFIDVDGQMISLADDINRHERIIADMVNADIEPEDDPVEETHVESETEEQLRLEEEARERFRAGMAGILEYGNPILKKKAGSE